MRGSVQEIHSTAFRVQVRPSHVIRFYYKLVQPSSKQACFSVNTLRTEVAYQQSFISSRSSAVAHQHLPTSHLPLNCVKLPSKQYCRITLLIIGIRLRFRADFIKASIAMGLYVVFQLTGSQLLRYHYRSTIYRDATASRHKHQTLYHLQSRDR